MGFSSHKCDEDIYENGEVVDIYTFPKTLLNILSKQLTEEGHPTDWNYVGGRAVVKTTSPEYFYNIKEIFDLYQWQYDQFCIWKEEQKYPPKPDEELVKPIKTIRR